MCMCLLTSCPPPALLLLLLLEQLTDLWLNDNQIESLDEVEAALQAQRPTLTCIYLSGNPCAATPSYRLRMQHLFPQLEQLDDSPLGEA